jgi:hypothetical protein
MTENITKNMAGNKRFFNSILSPPYFFLFDGHNSPDYWPGLETPPETAGQNFLLSYHPQK